MIFARYNPDTGDLTSIGATDDHFVNAEISEGKPTIVLNEYIEFSIARYEYIVDLETKTLVKREASVKPVSPELIRSISDRQFYQKAALEGYITQEDAIKAVQSGYIPAPLQNIIDSISDATEKFSATMLLSGATTFYRDHPFTDKIGEAFGMTPSQIDEFFKAAVLL